ncbi:hypothetical protein BU17DRAFT_67716 [Hysterangium stoloniferum]|nr:hypothetical protein BU17DRAFT_67716 [Hysterangium stoloniferum]
MSEPKITFLDISFFCKPQACRLVLNYKQIPYTRQFGCLSLISRIPSRRLGESQLVSSLTRAVLYTLPAILDESGDTPVVIADSLAIAEYLVTKYPERPVLPKTGRALEQAFEQSFEIVPNKPIGRLIQRPTLQIQNARSKRHYVQTRWDWYNFKPSEISPEGPVRDGHWNEFEKGLDKLAEVLDTNGPDAEWVAGGSEPTRADFITTAWLLWIKIVSPDEWEKKVKPLNGERGG